MIINDREVNFFYSIQARCEIEDMYNEDGFTSLAAMMKKNYTRTIIRMAEIMHRAYLAAHPEETCEPLTDAEMMSLPNAVFRELDEEIGRAMNDGKKVTVETEQEKTGKNAESAARSS